MDSEVWKEVKKVLPEQYEEFVGKKDPTKSDEEVKKREGPRKQIKIIRAPAKGGFIRKQIFSFLFHFF